MIEELHIRGLGVIEDARLPLAPGLTVVTGETGAGKTMLVTALELLLGARADTDLVRSGASAASVDVVVSPPPDEAAEFVEVGDELVVSREVPADGRSRARLDGRPVPAAALNQVLGRHVEVHAQHEHVRLAGSDVQRHLLDRYAGDPHARTLERYRQAYATWRDLTDRAERLEHDSRERARELDRLRSEVAEIDAAGLDVDVDGDIDLRLERLENADAVQQASLEAAAALG
ncbi:MAG: AAA family ATPase, partial [Actinomycetota bacterium]